MDETLKQAGFRPEAQAVDYISNANFQTGGPLLKNRLFYFGNVNNQQTHVNVPGYPAISPPQIPQITSGNDRDSTEIWSMSGKLNYQLGAANRFEGYGNYQWYDKPNRGARSDVTLDSNPKEDDTFLISQVSWNAVVTSQLVGDTKIAYSNTHFPLDQKTDQQTIVDNSTGVRLRNAAQSALMFRRRVQVTSNWNYYVPEFLSGRHEFKFGFDHGYTPEDVTTTRVGNVNLTWRSVQGTAAQPAGPGNVTIFNSPTVVKRAVTNTAFYGQDTFADRPADSHRRHPLRAGRGLHSAADARVEPVLPERHDDQRPERRPQHRRHADHLHRAGLVRRGEERAALEELGAARQRDLRPLGHRQDGAEDVGRQVLRSGRHRHAGSEPERHRQPAYPWNDLNDDLIFQPGNATWNGSRYVGGEFGTAP